MQVTPAQINKFFKSYYYSNLSNFSNYLSLTTRDHTSCQDEDEGFLAPRAREKPEA